MNAHFGQRYTVSATEALSEFQKVQLNQRAARNQLERVVDLQAAKGQPWDLLDRFVSALCKICEEEVSVVKNDWRRERMEKEDESSCKEMIERTFVELEGIER